MRSLQAELIQVSRQSAMGAMAATLAHELNQPLTAISNYAAGTRRALERAASGGDPGDGLDGDRGAPSAPAASSAACAITNGGAMPRQPIDPNPVIREAEVAGESGREERSTSLYVWRKASRVLADPVQVQQVVINLISNAAEAGTARPGARSGCRRRAAGNMDKIRVEDSGTGIAPEMLATLFDFAVRPSRTARASGLAVSRTIVEAHGGTLSAANLPRRRRVALRLTLPLDGDDGV